jgi:hypothetical protein
VVLLGPSSSCPYSPDCVEGEFSEVCSEKVATWQSHRCPPGRCADPKARRTLGPRSGRFLLSFGAPPSSLMAAPFLFPIAHRARPSLPWASRLPLQMCSGRPGAGHDSKGAKPPLCEISLICGMRPCPARYYNRPQSQAGPFLIPPPPGATRLFSCPYSPKCLEGVFREVRRHGFLRSS